MWKQVTARPVEMIAGVLMVGFGVAITASGSGAEKPIAWQVAGGGLLTTFGGVLLSWVVSETLAKQQAREEFNVQLDVLSRNLGQAAGQITRAIDQATLGEIDQETVLALVSQSVNVVYGQVNEVQVMRGERFDSADLLNTVNELDRLARQLDRHPGGGDDEIETVRRRIQDMKTSLSRTGATARTYSEAVVTCPNCGVENAVTLGDEGGATASPTCSACHQRFNAHRGSDGASFSRMPGTTATSSSSAGALVTADISCPECSTDIRVPYRDGSQPKKLIYCTACLSALQADLVDRSAVFLRKVEAVHGVVVDRSGSQPFIKVEGCAAVKRGALNTGERYYGICDMCQRLHYVTHEEAALFREKSSGSGE